MPGENDVYCNRCGTLTIDRFCSKCHVPLSDYIERETEKGKNWTNKEWAKKDYGDHLLRRYFCHNCKLYMFHPIQYCFSCGGRLNGEKHTSKEMIEKFADYKAGI